MKILDKWLKNLLEIREELLDTIKDIKEDELKWVPKPGMKSAKALLIEIAAGEIWLDHFLENPNEPFSWDDAFEQVKGDTLQALMNELASIRQHTIELFSRYTEKELFIEKTWPNRPDESFSPEETMRYLIQHEYYHLGQLIYNRWMLGYNPYLHEGTTSG